MRTHDLHRWLFAIAAATLLCGCAMSRQAQLERRADRLEDDLKSAQAKALATTPPDRTKLDHLTSIRSQLSLANVARGAVPYTVPEDQQPIAWDILDEVYGTPEWNLPLPASQARPLPAGFAGGKLNLQAAPDPRLKPPGIAN